MEDRNEVPQDEVVAQPMMVSLGGDMAERPTGLALWFDGEGNCIGLNPDPHGPSLLIARDQNPAYLKAQDANRRKMGLDKPRARNKLTNAQVINNVSGAMAKAILLDVRNVVGPDGNDLNGQDEQVRFSILRHNPDLRAMIQTCSADFDTFVAYEGGVTEDELGK